MCSLLVCTPTRDAIETPQLRAAARRAHVTLHPCVTPEDAHDVSAPRGVLALGRAAAAVAAQVAERYGCRWHAPGAVALTADRLRLLGRLTAARLPVPRYTTVDAETGDGVESLRGMAAPWRVTWSARGCSARVAGVDALQALAVEWVAGDAAAGPGTVDRRLLVESAGADASFVVVGLLEQGALRVVTILRGVSHPDAPDDLAAVISPSALPRAQQAHLAGGVAQACAALGLDHGPILATCRLLAGDLGVVDIAPASLDATWADALSLVDPQGAPCSLDDLLVRHAVGLPLDGYAHDGVYGGVRLAPARVVRGVSVDDVARQLGVQPASGT